ncbi:MAG: hypothetical protein CMF59_04550 [Leptospiraceae bacterium]|nr:hypothetical protein [Leptospiraceae bacterium]
MPFWNEKRVQEFVSGLGKGVQGATLEEFLGFLAGLLLVIFLIVWLQRRSDHAKQKSSRERSRALFEGELEERTLPPSAIRLMEDLAHAMEQANRAFEIHRLFRDPSLFDRFAGLLIEEDAELRRPLRLLKPILGLGHGFSGISQSTEELNPGERLSVRPAESIAMEFRVLSNDVQSLRVFSEDQTPVLFKNGMPVEVTWESRGVLHICQSRIMKIESERASASHSTDLTPAGESANPSEAEQANSGRVADGRFTILQLQHSEEIQRQHRRGFVRCASDLPAILAGHSILITNIGGGGFATERLPGIPESYVQKETALPCRIQMGKVWIECSVRFIQSSEVGFHFAFERIRPGDQDRIIHFALSNLSRESN